MTLHNLVKVFIILSTFTLGITPERAIVAFQAAESSVPQEHVQSISDDTFFTKIFGIDKTSLRGEFESSTALQDKHVTLFSTANGWAKSVLSAEPQDSICHNRLFQRPILASTIIPGISLSPKFTIMLQKPLPTTDSDIHSFMKQQEQTTADLSSLYEMLEDGTIDPEKHLQDMLRRPVQREATTLASSEAPLYRKDFSPLNSYFLPSRTYPERPTSDTIEKAYHLDNKKGSIGLHRNGEISSPA